MDQWKKKLVVPVLPTEFNPDVTPFNDSFGHVKIYVDNEELRKSFICPAEGKFTIITLLQTVNHGSVNHEQRLFKGRIGVSDHVLQSNIMGKGCFIL